MSAASAFWSPSNNQVDQDDQEDRPSQSNISDSEKDQITQVDNTDLNPGELTFEEGPIALPLQQL
ncbi:hypothetical protein AZE42_10942, partial [Rhizopogon vesiculosus]